MFFFFVLTLSWILENPAGIYLLKVNDRNTRARCELCSKLMINLKTPERRHISIPPKKVRKPKIFWAKFLLWRNQILVCISNICEKLYVLVMSRTYFRVNPLYSCLNVKELLARSRRKIWSLSDCSWTRTHNHLVYKRTLNHLAKMEKQLWKTSVEEWHYQ